MQAHADTTKPAQRLLDLDGLCSWLGVSERTARNWVEAKSIPVTKIDGRLRFDVIAVDRWLSRHTTKPEQAA